MDAVLAAVIADFGRIARVFDFTANGLGEEAAERNAAAIFEYMDAQTGPDNNPWQPLSDAYAKWKSGQFPGQPMSDLHHNMKDPSQLKGVVDVTADGVKQTYGLDDQARTEAVWFSEGNSRQPPRPFYQFNDLAILNLEDLFGRVWRDAVR